MGDHTSMITHIHKPRVYYSSLIPEARQACNTSKSTACYYFHREKCYQTIKPNKSYADALKLKNYVPTNQSHDLLCQASTNAGSTPVNRVEITPVRTPANRVNATTCFTKINKRQYQKPIKLHNRFHALQHIDTEYDRNSNEVCKQTEDVQNKLGVSRPVLDGRLKTTLAGNKNKTGYSGRDLIHNKLACARTEDRVTLSPDVSTATEIRTHFSDSAKAFDKNCVLHSTNNADQFQHVLTADTDTVYNSGFGFLPLEPLRLYTGDPVYYQTIPDIISTHLRIKNSGFPNFLKCRIPVESKLNVDRWRSHLANYWDQQLLDLLKYGFPIDFDRNCPLASTFVNHTSALQNDTHVSSYLQEELQHGAIIGPFMEPPFPIHISPLMTRDKQDSIQKRTIMDLSWPKGLSINNGVDKNTYLSTQYLLNYTSIDNITASLCKLGPAAQLFKIDISRAFRQIKIDPGDIDLLGMKFQDQYFLDLSVPFGYRHGSKIFQRCTDSICHIMSKNGFPGLYNYIDDLIFTGLPSKIHSAYQFLQGLLQELGLDISQKKLVPPSTSVTCLGILIDTIHRTISIPPTKLQEITNMCKNWVTKTFCSKTHLQSLLGSLLYITKCVKPARIFLNRILQLL